MNTEVKPKLSFTDNELKSLMANAMGRASEAGTAAVHKLGMAAGVKNGIVQHNDENSSGYTVGFFQWDFGGKKESARALVTAYNNWAVENKIATISNTEEIATRLNQNRDVDNPNHIMHDIRREDVGKNINKFLASDTGYQFILNLQQKQYENLNPLLQRAIASPSVQNMDKEDAHLVLVSVGKIANQMGVHANHLEKMLLSLENEKEMISATQFDAIAKSTKNKYAVKGVQHAALGAELYNKLTNDAGTLGLIFKEGNEKNSLDIPHFALSPKDQLLDAMFRNPTSGKKLVDAVNHNSDMLIQTNDAIRNEAYSVGVKEGIVFTIDKDGKGYQLNKGEWKAFDNTKEAFLYQDLKTNKWALEAPVLERGSKGEEVRELQNRLNAINPADKQLDVTPDAKEANFGPATEKALKEFQKAHQLPETGKFDKATQTQLSEIDHIKEQVTTKADIQPSELSDKTQIPELPPLELVSPTDRRKTLEEALAELQNTQLHQAELQTLLATLAGKTSEISQPDLKIDFLEVANKTIKFLDNEKGACLNINGKDCDLSSFKRFGETMTAMQTYQNGDRSLLGKFLPESDQFELYHRSAYGADKVAIVNDFSQQQIIQLNNLEATKDKSLSQQKSTSMER